MGVCVYIYISLSETRSKIRYLEKLEKKLVKANIAMLFNRTCFNEEIYIYSQYSIMGVAKAIILVVCK